jgi:site-specific DNA recombinase
MKTAIYVRVSTQDQAEEGYSIGRQTESLIKYCETREWSVSRIFCDAGYSGSNMNRPHLQALINSISSFDAVLVYKLDRLSRSQKDTLYLLEDVFEAHGVSFFSLSESFDTSSPFGKAAIGILSVFAQLEREQIRERMAMGRLGRIKSGKTSAWAVQPFGYDYAEGELIPNSEEGLIVRHIYEDFLAGKTVTQIAKELNVSDFLCRKKVWYYRTVKAVLTNAVYTGVTNYKGQIYRGNHIPIIDSAIFESVRAELESRRKCAASQNNNLRPFSPKYMLSGLLECGYCGSGFKIVLGRVKADGSRSRKYECVMNRAVTGSRCAREKRKLPKTKGRRLCRYSMEELEVRVITKLRREMPGAVPTEGPNEMIDVESLTYQRHATTVRELISKIIVTEKRIRIVYRDSDGK